jgi:hypothetical protein
MRRRSWTWVTVAMGLALGCGANRAPYGQQVHTNHPRPAEAEPASTAKDEVGGSELPGVGKTLPPAIERIVGQCINVTLRRRLTIGDGTFSVSERENLDETEVEGTYTVTASDEWSVTGDYQTPTEGSRRTVSILDDGLLYVHSYGHGRLCEPVDGPIAHGPGEALRRALLARLQGSWTKATEKGASFSLIGTKAQATVEGSTYGGRLTIRAASKSLLIVDLAADNGDGTIAILHFLPDGSLDVELRRATEERGWVSYGGGSFVKTAP